MSKDAPSNEAERNSWPAFSPSCSLGASVGSEERGPGCEHNSLALKQPNSASFPRLLLVRFGCVWDLWLPAWCRGPGGQRDTLLVGQGLSGSRISEPSLNLSGFKFLFSWHSMISCFKEKTRGFKSFKKKALGHEMALTKQHVDELSINESETYGLNFPCNPQGFQN